ncbi:Calcium-transporting ATPase 3, endoplasmic reticulum-type [Folsomia candida]|uniref:Calcium-transporting ATPase 3, endoplasmic reticulum-type n=1 Tax=Folsomia candida TaxID=158441 RepID=A0A226EB59_FOLCA|nr:Calcium-transporting ATPase 3, endoplasmic reticulum-type [Folsomia candida]
MSGLPVTPTKNKTPIPPRTKCIIPMRKRRRLSHIINRSNYQKLLSTCWGAFIITLILSIRYFYIDPEPSYFVRTSWHHFRDTVFIYTAIPVVFMHLLYYFFPEVGGFRQRELSEKVIIPLGQKDKIRVVDVKLTVRWNEIMDQIDYYHDLQGNLTRCAQRIRIERDINSTAEFDSLACLSPRNLRSACKKRI